MREYHRKNGFRRVAFWRWSYVAFAILLLPSIGVCHRVTIFAWVEGDQVHTESKVGGGKELKDAIIDVYDLDGNQLLQGKTDPSGKFTFKAPVKSDLRLVLHAGMGHQAEWTVRKEDFGSSPIETDSVPEAKTVATAVQTDKGKTVAPVSLSISDQKNFEALLDQKLAPIMRQLNELREQTQAPSLTDVFGGIGYILGLFGVVAYVKGRRG